MKSHASDTYQILLKNATLSTKDVLEGMRNSKSFHTNKETFHRKRSLIQVVEYMKKNDVEFATNRVPNF